MRKRHGASPTGKHQATGNVPCTRLHCLPPRGFYLDELTRQEKDQRGNHTHQQSAVIGAIYVNIDTE